MTERPPRRKGRNLKPNLRERAVVGARCRRTGVARSLLLVDRITMIVVEESAEGNEENRLHEEAPVKGTRFHGNRLNEIVVLDGLLTEARLLATVRIRLVNLVIDKVVNLSM